MVKGEKRLYYRDDFFDVALLLFVLHHIPENMWETFLKEAKRVAKGEVIILDHVQHDFPFLSLIQRIYWRLFDGGCAYRKKGAWFPLLQSHGFIVKDYKRMGTMFGNICYFRLGKA